MPAPCPLVLSFSCGLWSIKLSRSIRLRRFIARRLASRFDRTRRLGRGLPGAVLEKVVGAVDNGRKTPKKPCLTWTWTLSSSGFRSRLFRVRSRKQMQPVYNSENTKAHCCSSGVPSFECGYDPQLTTSGSTDLLRIGMNRISVGRSHLNLFEVSLRGRGRGRGWERAECWNVLAALAAHSERDLKDLKLSRKKVRIFWSKSAANACCRVPFGKRWAYTPGRSESSPRRASEKKRSYILSNGEVAMLYTFLQVVGQPGGGSFKDERAIEHKKSVPIGWQFLGLWRCAGTIFWHLTSCLITSFSLLNFFSAHLISCLLSSSQLFSAPPSSSQLISSVLISCQLFFSLLSSSEPFSVQLISTQVVSGFSELFLHHLSSS